MVSSEPPGPARSISRMFWVPIEPAASRTAATRSASPRKPNVAWPSGPVVAARGEPRLSGISAYCADASAVSLNARLLNLTRFRPGSRRVGPRRSGWPQATPAKGFDIAEAEPADRLLAGRLDDFEPPAGALPPGERSPRSEDGTEPAPTASPPSRRVTTTHVLPTAGRSGTMWICVSRYPLSSR
jgi:hypothetical protein